MIIPCDRAGGRARIYNQTIRKMQVKTDKNLSHKISRVSARRK